MSDMSALRTPGRRVCWPRFRAYVDGANLSVNLGPLRRAFSEVIWFFAFWANTATA